MHSYSLLIYSQEPGHRTCIDSYQWMDNGNVQHKRDRILFIDKTGIIKLVWKWN